MFRQHTSFLGHDLKKGSEIIAVTSGLISLVLIPILVCGGVAGEDVLLEAEWADRNLPQYGGSSAFCFVALHTAIQEIVHIFICVILYYGVKADNANTVRIWVRSSAIWLCLYTVFVPYASFLLYSADVRRLIIVAPFGLLVFYPFKLYMTLIVYSYYNTISTPVPKDHVCEYFTSVVNIWTPVKQPTSQATSEQPAEIVVSRS